MREELRGFRFAMEYYKADLLLREWGVRSTVVVFGSARIPAAAAVDGLLAAAATVPAGCIAEAFEAWRGADFGDALAKVTARTVVVATDDPFLPPDFLRAAIVGRIAGARLAVLPGAGHYVPVERSREVAALLTAFLAGLG